jgi:hypothetical protein
VTHDEPGRSRAAGERPDDFDRVIDRALEAMSHDARVDLRARVLSRLDEAAVPPPAIWVVLRRPATFAVATVALIVAIAVTMTWRQADSGPERDSDKPQPPVQARRPEPASIPQNSSAAAGSRAASVAGAKSELAFEPSVARPARSPAVAGRACASLPAELTADGQDAADPAEPVDARLPGAPAGEPGDPIPLLPAPSPIVIPPIAPPPIVVLPSVVNLGTPVGMLPIIDPARGGPQPGKNGGVSP